jgi:predicted acetyltransferase
VELSLRVVPEDAFVAYERRIQRAFGFNQGGDVADERSLCELDRTLAIFDGDDVVATAGAYSFELTLPGGAVVPVAGITTVSVATTYRRRGLLSQMMDRQLTDIAERGEPAAVLWASEAPIYERFGYGLAMEVATLTVDSDRGRLVRPAACGGAMELLEVAEPEAVIDPLYDQLRRTAPGAVSRSREWWRQLLGPRRSFRGGGSPFIAVHRSGGGALDGFVTYVVDRRPGAGLADAKVVVIDLYGVDAEVETALWQHAMAVDLTGRVQALNRPLDEALPWRLQDWRDATWSHRHDGLWARLVDVPAALAARAYPATGALVLDVTDRFRPDAAGLHRLEADGGKGRCEVVGAASAASAPADVRLDVADLATLWLGGATASTLARAGRLVELRPGAVARADALFATDRLPFCSTPF